MQQPNYSEAEDQVWARLYARMLPRWQEFGNERFLHGVESLCFRPDRVPRLDDVNRFLCPLTGFQAEAVAGYLPAFLFFDSLRNRKFPTTVTIRGMKQLDYLPEPDIFHDIAGHVPMHTDPAFAETLVRFGECSHTAAEMAQGSGDDSERIRRLTSRIRAMARFFWFTVEFGLMQQGGALKAYGSGLLSSYGELQHALLSPGVRREPIRLETVIHQAFSIDRYQPLLFIVEGFDHLFKLVGELEQWMQEGRLDDVAAGEPGVDGRDLTSFLHMSSS